MADDLAESPALPVIDARRCTLAASEGGDCRTCVDGCPKKALSLESGNLYINILDCDGCGACAAVCSKGAITVPVEPLMDGGRSTRWAFAACSQSERMFAPAPALVPCLHTIGLETLAELYRRGVRELVTSVTTCEACPTRAPQRLAARVESFNSFLSPQAMDPIRIIELPSVEWRRRRDAAVHAAKKALLSAIHPGVAPARRALLVARKVTSGAAETPGDPEAPMPGVPTSEIPLPEIPMSALPRINAQLCTGCLACVKACPHDVFALVARPEGRCELLVADGRRCTGCSLCFDACSTKSISIVRGRQAQSSAGVALGHAVCKACGEPFRLPVARADGRALCSHCRSVNRGTMTPGRVGA
jgi:ferredoxin